MSRLGDAAGAGREIERRRDAADAGDQSGRAVAELASELQDDVAAQRESDQKCRRAELAQNREKVAGEPGVVQRLAKMLRPAARPHVEAVGGIAGVERRGAETADVPGAAGALQSVHHDDLAGATPAADAAISTST